MKRISKSQLAICLVFILVALLVIAVLVVLYLGARASNNQVFFAIAFFAFLAAVVTWLLFPRDLNRAEASGRGWRIVGPGASFIIFFVVLFSLWRCMDPEQTVQVYLRPADGALIDRFRVESEIPRRGQRTDEGTNGHAILQGLPRQLESLRIRDIGCFGYAMKRLKHGEPSPWQFPIVDGEVQVEMVRATPAAPADPVELTRNKIHDRGLHQDALIATARFPKEDVELIIKKSFDTDSTVTIVIVDCVRAWKAIGAADLDNISWPLYFNVRIQKDEREKQFRNFKVFQKPSGWFAFFILYEADYANEIRQEFLGIENIFQTQSPRITLRHGIEQKYVASIDP